MGEARDAINASAARQVATLDIGAGDQHAPANAIPNIIARLVETETWRNAATVVMGGLLIGLGYWSYHGDPAGVRAHDGRACPCAGCRNAGARRCCGDLFILGRSGRGDVVGSFDKVDFFFPAAKLNWKF